MNEPTISLEELRRSGKIFWVKSSPSLRRWVLLDMATTNILKPVYIRVPGKKKGLWKFNTARVDEYVEAYKKGELNSNPNIN